MTQSFRAALAIFLIIFVNYTLPYKNDAVEISILRGIKSSKCFLFIIINIKNQEDIFNLKT